MKGRRNCVDDHPTHTAGARRLRQVVYAAAVVLAPLALIPGTIFNPGSAALAKALPTLRPTRLLIA
jgi:hypothetical protein